MVIQIIFTIKMQIQVDIVVKVGSRALCWSQSMRRASTILYGHG